MSVRIIKVATPITGEDEAAAIREVVLSGQFVSGKKVAEFERRFASYVGVDGGIALNSGTAALHVALAALNIGPGDEVIVPALTFMSTVTSVLHQNAIPVFADIELESFCISPDDIGKRISPRTKAIIPVHLFGNAAEMDGIMAIAEEHDLFVIEDCAQAHGTEYKGKRVGSIGHMGAFSFFATKHMTTGEGGMITAGREEWLERGRRIRSHGLVGRDDHAELGYNYRMNELAAAMGLVQLDKLESFNETRIQNSQKILAALAATEDSWFEVPQLAPHIRHTFFWCPLRVRAEKGFSTQEIIAGLAARGVEVRHRYSAPLYKQKLMLEGSPYPGGCPFTCNPADGRQDYGSLFLPNAEKIAGNVIGLPNHAKLTNDDIEYVIETVRGLY